LKHIRELVVPMCLNASGIRDTARVLRISAATVMKMIGEQAKNLPPIKLPEPIADVEHGRNVVICRKEKESVLVVAGILTKTPTNAGFFAWQKNR
jgi:hypothetical protein